MATLTLLGPGGLELAGQSTVVIGDVALFPLASDDRVQDEPDPYSLRSSREGFR